jgi:hypothetical protein
MAFRSPSDGAPISPNQPSFGTPDQTKVSGDRQRETTHEICFLAAECVYKDKSLSDNQLPTLFGTLIVKKNIRNYRVRFFFFESVFSE